MAYIFRQKFNIKELVDLREPVKKVLVVEPEEYLLALYSYHISLRNFHVLPCSQPDMLMESLASFQPHACICDARLCGTSQDTAKKLESVRQVFPGMLIVTIGYAQEDVRELMNAGASAHIDRRTSRPADVAEVLRSLLF